VRQRILGALSNLIPYPGNGHIPPPGKFAAVDKFVGYDSCALFFASGLFHFNRGLREPILGADIGGSCGSTVPNPHPAFPISPSVFVIGWHRFAPA
jgi:hypothetical protein